MSKNSLSYLFFYLALTATLSFASCKSKKKIQHTENVQNTTEQKDTLDERCKLDYKNGKALTRLMKEKELDFKTATGKFNCELSMDDDDHSFSVSVRCRKDSAIWMNISKLGIDAVRALITKDSVKFMIMAGSNKGYFNGDFSFINDTLNADLDYEMLQALLFGNSADFLTDSIKLKGGKDKKNCQYLLSTIRKRKLRKVMEGQFPKESAQTMWLNPETFKIAMLEFDDADMKRKFNACYDDFQPLDNFTAPFKMLYTIMAEKTIKADIRYARIKLNDEISFPYKVPASYEPIQLKHQHAEQMTQAESEALYTEAMKKGNEAMANKEWQQALDAFNEALLYKKGDQLAKLKKEDAEKNLKGQ